VTTFVQAGSGSNTFINETTGIVRGPSTADSVIGSFGSAVDFTRRGTAIGGVKLSGGNDQLHLYTGSSIAGTMDGGSGNNLLTLNGVSSGSMSGA
jgi:hypothetical protein